MEPLFDHEKLEVYQKSLSFATWVPAILNEIPKSSSLHDQLDRASTSIPLNIAEGNGKWSKKDRCRFFDNAKGSTLECASALDTAVAGGLLEKDNAYDGKLTLVQIFRMLVGLIQANDPDRKLEKGSMRVGEEASLHSDENGEKEKD